MIGFICFIVFMILNFVNANIVVGSFKSGLCWQFWIATLCTCGCYLAGYLKCLFKTVNRS